DLSDVQLPEGGTDGQLTLLLATWLADRLRDGHTDPVPEERLRRETRRLIEKHKTHWRKDVQKPGSENGLTRDVLVRLCALGLARRVTEPESALLPLPAIGRFALRTSGLETDELRLSE
ncbi:MAG: DUF2398 family protein, partial [Verrucomicrobiota bacterium]